MWSRRDILTFGCAALAAGLAREGFTMGKKPDATLYWEWPAGRTPDRFAVARVEDFSKEAGGLFGRKRSPSLAENLPDAHALTAVWESGPDQGRTFRLVLPRPEAGDLRAGQRVGLGLVAGTTCICIRAIPPEIPDADALAWTRDAACSGRD
jgi:hypothetical protein